jgi:hypothetical protein
MSRIIELRAENVKRLSAVHITPKGNLVIIGGKNGAGKTSVLDAIQMTLGGAKEFTEQPVRRGQERATVVIETEEFVITRNFTAAGGSTLTVKNRDGMRADAPQAILDKLTGKLAFDPVAFLRLEPAKQREALKKLVPVDFTEDDNNRSRLYIERTHAGRKLEDAVAVLHSLPSYPNTPDVEVSVTDTVAELERAQSINQTAKDLAEAAENAHSDVMDAAVEASGIERGIANTEAEIARLQRLLAELRDEHAAKLRRVEELKAKAEAAAKAATDAPTVDLTPIREKLAGAELTNQHVRANARKDEQRKLVDSLTAQLTDLTKAIDHIDAEKKRKLSEAKFPVPGLAFDDRGVTFDGLPFSEASAAQKLRVSVAMAAALNPKLRVMLVRDAAFLDEDSLAQLEQLAAEHDLQVWAERVSQGSECQVIIEDGAVLEAAGSEAA